MARLLLYLFLWIGAMGLAIFTGQNIVLVTIRLGSLESIKLPLGLVLTFCCGLGAIAVTLLQASMRSASPINSQSISFRDKFFTSPKSTKSVKSSPASEKNQKQKPVRQKSGDDFDDDWDDDWN